MWDISPDSKLIKKYSEIHIGHLNTHYDLRSTKSTIWVHHQPVISPLFSPMLLQPHSALQRHCSKIIKLSRVLSKCSLVFLLCLNHRYSLMHSFFCKFLQLWLLVLSHPKKHQLGIEVFIFLPAAILFSSSISCLFGTVSSESLPFLLLFLLHFKFLIISFHALDFAIFSFQVIVFSLEGYNNHMDNQSDNLAFSVSQQPYFQKKFSDASHWYSFTLSLSEMISVSKAATEAPHSQIITSSTQCGWIWLSSQSITDPDTLLQHVDPLKKSWTLSSSNLESVT